MKIVLAKCPRAHRSHFQENSESLALGYLKASLVRSGFLDVVVVDGSLQGMDCVELSRFIGEQKPRLIGFTISDATFLESTLACAAYLRKANVQAHIILGGYTPSFQPTETLTASDAVDSVCMFEGERCIVELARAIESGTDWRNVEGLAYRRLRNMDSARHQKRGNCDQQDGSNVARNALPSAERDLDQLPFPARDSIPFILTEIGDRGVVMVSTSRGCYANCGFCSIRAFAGSVGGPPLRLRSVTNIVDELEELVERFGVREFQLIDDIFVVPSIKGLKRLDSFAEELDRRRLRLMFSISERATTLSKIEVCERLHGIGVRQILIGVEAGTDELLDYYNKETTCNENEVAIKNLDRFDMDPTVSFINFSPRTSLSQLRDNIRFLLTLRVNCLQGMLNRFQVYPGTPLGDEMLQGTELRGSFPHYEYDCCDKRADLVHAVVSRAFGPLLTTAFHLKTLERKLRRRLFKAQEQRNGTTSDARKARAQFRELQHNVVGDACNLFEEVIDRVECGEGHTPEALQNLTNEMREVMEKRLVSWSSKLLFFEFCNEIFEEDCGWVRVNTPFQRESQVMKESVA